MQKLHKLLPPLYCITLMLFCQPIVAAHAISELQSAVIVDNCTAIKDSLKKVQQDDSRTRVYLGGYYETLLSKFVTPFNLRLVENSLSTASFVENQNLLASTRSSFMSDFVTYQRELEALINIDCATEPSAFYDKLVDVRARRATVRGEVTTIRTLAGDHLNLIQTLKEQPE